MAGETLSDTFVEGPVPAPAEGLGETPKEAGGGWFAQALDLEGDAVKVAIRKVK